MSTAPQTHRLNVCSWLQADSGWAENYFCFTPRSRPSRWSTTEGPFLTHRRHGALLKEVKHWSLTTLREKLVKIGAKVFSHGRYVIFQMAELAIPRDLLADILRRIDRLRPKPVST